MSGNARRTRILGLAFVVLLLNAGAGSSQDTLLVNNNTGGFMSLWVWKEQDPRWQVPPLSLPRGVTRELDIRAPGQYYLVARDDVRRDFHMGWFDFREELRKQPVLVLGLNSAMPPPSTRDGRCL